jgi:hypothetical protein
MAMTCDSAGSRLPEVLGGTAQPGENSSDTADWFRAHLGGGSDNEAVSVGGDHANSWH